MSRDKLTFLLIGIALGLWVVPQLRSRLGV